MTTPTVIKCLAQRLAIFEMPTCVHPDRRPSFLSVELKQFLHSHGISTSHTTAYNPPGNGQVESCWKIVLPDALHSIRCFLCTVTNATPHECLFSYQ